MWDTHNLKRKKKKEKKKTSGEYNVKTNKKKKDEKETHQNIYIGYFWMRRLKVTIFFFVQFTVSNSP